MLPPHNRLVCLTTLALLTLGCGPAPSPRTGTRGTAAKPASTNDQPGQASGGPADPEPAQRGPTAAEQEVARLEAIAEEKKRDPEVFLALGVAMAKAGDPRGAARQFKRASRYNPKDFRPVYNLGLIQLRGGSVNEALKSLAQAAKLNPKKIEIQVDLAVAQRQAKRVKASLKTLRRIKRAHGAIGARVQFNLGLTLEALGRAKPAKKAYQRAVTLDPRNIKAQLKLGVLLSRDKDHKGAAEAFRAALAARPNNAEARFNLGVALLQLGDNAGAAEQLNRAATNRPKDGLLRMNLGLAQSRKGDHAAAARAYRAAARLLTSSSEARLLLGFALARSGDAAGAQKAATSALRMDAKLRPGLDPVIQELVKAEQTACALALTRAVLAVLPDDKVARHNQLALESMLKRTTRP
jgi:Flp pilus assembly protein TadD